MRGNPKNLESKEFKEVPEKRTKSKKQKEFPKNLRVFEKYQKNPC